MKIYTFSIRNTKELLRDPINLIFGLGLSFLTLFSATIISRDRGSSFLERLYTTPMTSADFILGYTLPIVPLAILQSLVCYITAIILGLKISINIIYAIIFITPISILYIAIGLLCGSVLNDKQVGGVCGALLTNLTAWASGVWFDLELVGGAFKKISYMLPFVHAVELQRGVLVGNFTNVVSHLLWVLGYAVVLLILAVFMFLKQMKK